MIFLNAAAGFALCFTITAPNKRIFAAAIARNRIVAN